MDQKEAEEFSKEQKNCPPKGKKHCTSPEQLFTTAVGFSAFLAANLSTHELKTLINLFALITNCLSSILTQHQICKRIQVEFPPEAD